MVLVLVLFRHKVNSAAEIEVKWVSDIWGPCQSKWSEASDENYFTIYICFLLIETEWRKRDKGERRHRQRQNTANHKLLLSKWKSFFSLSFIVSFASHSNWLRDVKRLFHYVMDAEETASWTLKLHDDQMTFFFVASISSNSMRCVCSSIGLKMNFALPLLELVPLLFDHCSLCSLHFTPFSIVQCVHRMDQVSLLQLHVESLSGLTLMHTTNLVILRTLKWNFAFSTRNHTRRRPQRRIHSWDNA